MLFAGGTSLSLEGAVIDDALRKFDLIARKRCDQGRSSTLHDRRRRLSEFDRRLTSPDAKFPQPVNESFNILADR